MATGPGKSVLVRTMALMMAIIILPFGFLFVQLFKIQIIDQDKYTRMAVEQQTRDTVITPKRGTIFDRNLKPLAESATVETVFVSPAEVTSEEKEVAIATGLSEILDVDYDFILQGLQNKNNHYFQVKVKIEKELADRVRDFIAETKLRGIHIEEDSKRYYKYGDFASQVIGFVGTENKGLAGVEAQYDKYLLGMPGRVITAKNGKGTNMPFQYESFYQATEGFDVVLTIDEVVQHFLEKHLETALIENGVENKVTGIVMDIKTGEILAMSTKPGFDLNQPFTLTDPEIIAQLELLEGDARTALLINSRNEMWRNRAVSEPYEPGSTFKIMTAAMSLEEKSLSSSQSFYCGGSTVVGSHTIRCWKAGGHGNQTFAQALQNSCNMAFIKIGDSVGNLHFKRYITAFGLIEKTGIDLPVELPGIFHPDERFGPKNSVELAVSSFGQTFKVTPIQLIRAVAGIANDGKVMRPHVVKQIIDKDGNVRESFEPVIEKQVVSSETSQTLCNMLESVVSIGTGKNAYIKGYRVGGKTGTSEKRDKINPDGTISDAKIASFIGIAPCDDPQIAVLVLLDEPTGFLKQGGQIAAPVVGRIFEDILPYLNIDPVYTAEELSGMDITIPVLTAMEADAAIRVLNDRKIAYKTVGSGTTVTAQIPVGGARVPKNAQIILYLGVDKPADMVQVPNVKGLSPEATNRVLAEIGLYMKAAGATSARTATVLAARQDVAPGTQVERGTIIKVEFYDNSQTGE